MPSFYANLIKNIKDISEIKNSSTDDLIFGDYARILTEQGLCFGLTFMWVRAVLRGEKEKRLYFLRLQYLTRDYSQNPLNLDGRNWVNLSALLDYLYRLEIGKSRRIVKTAPTIIEKLAQKPPYFSQDPSTRQYFFEEKQLPDLLRSIYPFLDSTTLYLNPRETSLYQDQAIRGVERQNPLVGSEILKHYLHLSFCKPFIGPKELLGIFFTNITNDIRSSRDAPFCMTINNNRHIIGVLIQQTQSVIFNANFMSKNFFEWYSQPQDNMLKSLTEQVAKSFINQNLTIQIWTLKEWRHNFHFDVTNRWYLQYLNASLQQDINFSANFFSTLVQYCHSLSELRWFFENSPEPLRQMIVTPVVFFEACEYGNTEYLQILLEKKPELLNRLLTIRATETDMNVLHAAVKHGQISTVEFLFANIQNVDPNTVSKKGTPLQLACKYQWDDIILFLLAHGARGPSDHLIHLYSFENKSINSEIVQRLKLIQ